MQSVSSINSGKAIVTSIKSNTMHFLTNIDINGLVLPYFIKHIDKTV